jgi:hypothetical protein
MPKSYILDSGNVGKTVAIIIGLCRDDKLSRLEVAQCFGVKLNVLLEWVSNHQADFGGYSEIVTTLLGKKASLPKLPRTTVPAGNQAIPAPVPGGRSAVIGPLTVSADVKAKIDAYCSANGFTYEQLFHRVVIYEMMATEADKIGISAGIFEKLVEYYGGVRVGLVAFKKVNEYCQKNGTKMEDLFGEFDASKISDMASAIGIQPSTLLCLVKFFNGSLAPVTPSA